MHKVIKNNDINIFFMIIYIKKVLFFSLAVKNIEASQALLRPFIRIFDASCEKQKN